MNILNIDFDSLLQPVIDIYTKIYGEEYRYIISNRVNRAIILSYQDPEEIGNYASFLRDCKAREYSIKFLEKIGMDMQAYKKKNYTQPLDGAVESLLRPYIYASYFGMCINTANTWAPLRAFDPDNISACSDDNYKKGQLLKSRIELVNFLRGDDKEKLTEETFLTFMETEEYKIIIEKINKLRAIHDELLTQYKEWEKCVLPYEEYANAERKRKKEILQKKKEELFDEIFYDIPHSIKLAMEGKSKKEQEIMFFTHLDIGSTFRLENFSTENINKLISPDVSFNEKSWIILYQNRYLESLGLKVPKLNVDENKSEEFIENHLRFINQENVRCYIPSEELITRIKAIREKKYEEALREYYTTRTDFIRIMNRVNNASDATEYIYDNIKNKKVCVTINGGSKDGVFVSVMFYTPKSDGHSFGSFLHEIEHVIDHTKDGCGFEPIETFGISAEKNQYDKKFRKYEKFNETITDMLKNDALDFFQSQGIYHIEPQEFVVLDVSDWNTAAITKELLKPLLQQFRKEIIRAKIYVDQAELTKVIGVDNFEMLVDIVNKVDYLSRNGLISKLNDSPDNQIVIDYKEQVERTEQVYKKINAYISQHKPITSILYSNEQIISEKNL